jgi:hypothetical protein
MAALAASPSMHSVLPDGPRKNRPQPHLTEESEYKKWLLLGMDPYSPAIQPKTDGDYDNEHGQGNILSAILNL